MTVSLCSARECVPTVSLCNGNWESLIRHGVLLPAGCAMFDSWTYHGPMGHPEDGSLAVNADVARSVGLATIGLRDAIRDGIARKRAWVSDMDRDMYRHGVFDAIAEFCATCGGFTVG